MNKLHFWNTTIIYTIGFLGLRALSFILLPLYTNLLSAHQAGILFIIYTILAFLNTIYNKEPWEDLSIGFQSKIIRYPNQYNLKFWYYFTNEYITQKKVRSFTECQNCEKITQLFDKLIT